MKVKKKDKTDFDLEFFSYDTVAVFLYAAFIVLLGAAGFQRFVGDYFDRLLPYWAALMCVVMPLLYFMWKGATDGD